MNDADRIQGVIAQAARFREVADEALKKSQDTEAALAAHNRVCASCGSGKTIMDMVPGDNTICGTGQHLWGYRGDARDEYREAERMARAAEAQRAHVVGD